MIPIMRILLGGTFGWLFPGNYNHKNPLTFASPLFQSCVPRHNLLSLVSSQVGVDANPYDP